MLVLNTPVVEGSCVADSAVTDVFDAHDGVVGGHGSVVAVRTTF
jgi:hypothetical protein